MKKVLAGILFLFACIPLTINAQQILGGDITWTCLTSGSDAGKFVFQLRLFNQCDSGGVSKSAQTIAVLGGPIGNISCSYVSETNISLDCYDPLQTIACGNSGSGAVSEAIYRSSPVSLIGTPPSSGWKFVYNAGNRPLNTNLASNTTFGLRSVMYSFQNKNTSTCYDNSAQFAHAPSTRLCTGYNTNFNHMAFDPDLDDNVAYSFEEPWGAVSTWPGSPLSFDNGYSFQSPFPGLYHDSSNVSATIEPLSGEINYTSNTIDRIAHTYKVSSYKSGILVSEVYRDYTLDLVSCPPTATIPPLSNTPTWVIFKDSANQSTNLPYPVSKTIMAGDSVEIHSFGTDIEFLPNFVGQTVTVKPAGYQFGQNFNDPSQGCEHTPCAYLDTNTIYYNGNSNTWGGQYGYDFKFKWQTDSAHAGSDGKIYNFYFRTQDDWCPTPGVSEKVISIEVLPQPPNKIQGVVYNDLNGNGSKDPGENGVKHALVKQSPSQFYYSSKSDGSYSLGAYQGTHTISITPPKYYSITAPTGGTHSVTTSGSGNTYGGNDFGVQAIPNVNDLMTKLTRQSALRPGDTVVFKINYKNIGTSTLSADIGFNFDSHFSYLSSIPTHSIQTGDSAKWSVSNLTPGSSGMIKIWLKTDTNAVLGTKVKFFNSISPISGDTVPGNNIDSVIATISNSWDPNNKIASPEAYYNQDSNYVFLNSVKEGLYNEYTVNFQNTGNAPAINVRIEDVLQDYLIMETFEFLGASHPVEYDIERRKITWQFDSINLPDSGSNYLGSMGFVKFRILVDTSLQDKDTIFNSINIYFDNNPPIYAISTVGIKKAELIDGVNEKHRIDDAISIYPNPSSGKFTIDVEVNEKSLAQYEVYNISGKRIATELLTLKNGRNLFEIDLQNEKRGVYFIHLKGKELNKALKLIRN